MSNARILNRTARLTGLALAAALLAGCTTVKNHRGYVSDAQLVEALQVGIDTRDSVRGTLGEPTFVSSFPPNDWYYVNNDTAQVAFNDPKIRQVEVVRFQFDATGNLTGVAKSGKELASRVNPMKGETPTMGRDGGFLEDLFGNVGAVGTPGLPGAGSQGGVGGQ